MSRILVVDDEPYLADLVATALRYERFETAIAATGAAAVAMTDSLRPDLIVLDVMLPDVLGTEVCRRIRAAGVEIPVVFLTARDATEDKIGGLTVGRRLRHQAVQPGRADRPDPGGAAPYQAGGAGQ